MFCTRCGTGNPDQATFCLSCGLTLSGEDKTAPRQPASPEGGIDAIPHSESRHTGSRTEAAAVPAEFALAGTPDADETARDALSTSPPALDGQRSETVAEPSRWRRAVGWTLVALGTGVAVVALIGMIAAQGGVSTAVANVMGRESGPGGGPVDAASLENVIFTPNVVGLPKATAIERLESVGVAPDDVTFTSRPSAVSSELVMDQVPRPGEAVSGSVALVIADPVIVMPDVIGLDADIAIVVLKDAGIDPASIAISERPFATVPQLVLEQTPRAGTDAPTTVELTLASIALAPDVVGMPVDDAFAALGGIGAEATLVSVPILDIEPQTIVGQSVPVGSAVTGPVELSIATEPPSVSLNSLDSDDSDRCYTDTVEVGDTNYPDTVYCNAREEQDGWIVFRLNRAFSRLRLRLGMLNSSNADSALVEMRGDGALAESLSVSKGAYPAVDLPVGNYSAIEIRVRGDNAKVALLDARLYEPSQPVP